MAWIECNFFSETLMLSTKMTVLLPEQTAGQVGQRNVRLGDKHPTLYLLHGATDDDTIWLRRTSIERYVAPLGIAVVMPQVHLSFYTDMKYGMKFGQFISEELPEIARSFFHLSDKREDNFIAGLSMGGYGAFKQALTYPDRYAAAASLSGVLDIAAHHARTALSFNPLALVFGDEQLENTKHDLFHLADQVARSSDPKPLLYQACGTEDFLYEQNQKFRDHSKSLQLPLTYVEGPGTHDWAYWDATIQDVLRWLPIQQPASL
ncbi:alpha/beta hydrolase [Paenibacillus yanchengensis]|uniref:Alpha/beta hydrolase n=1 Tax=Paenibacillus yanchengensis TaxID=2035833 RepID=A0ABW4YQ03_9BACL